MIADPLTIPLFADRMFNVLFYGADPTGIDDCTAAFQAAADACYAAGGGIVLVPRGKYMVFGTLVFFQNVSLIGSGPALNAADAKQGTQIVHAPPTANTDFLIVRRDPAGADPTSYAATRIAEMSIRGSVNSRDGIYLQMVWARMSRVVIYDFSAAGLRLSGMINSSFDQVMINRCDVGLDFDTTGTVSTTCAFRACYLSNHRVAARVRHCNSASFGPMCIFESCREQGMIIDDATVHLDAPYFEDIGLESIKAGFSSRVQALFVTGGVWVGGGMSDETTPVVSLDDVLLCRMEPMDIRVDKRALVQTTVKTGLVFWGAAPNVQAASAPTRADSATYSVGAKFGVKCDDGAPRLFEVVVAGTSGASQPGGYSYYNLNKQDGTCEVSSYGPLVVADPEKLVQFGRGGVISGARVGSEYKGSFWFMGATYEFSPYDFRLMRSGAAFRILYSAKSDKASLDGVERFDRIALRMNDTDKLSTHGFGTQVCDGQEVINPVADKREVQMLTQRNLAQGFIHFNSPGAPDLTRPLSSLPKPGTIREWARVVTPSGIGWLPIYNNPQP